MDIILASASPRRKELLTQMGLSFRVVAADIDEHMDRELSPDRLVEAISAEKAAAVAAGAGANSLVIAADTVVEGSSLRHNLPRIPGRPDQELVVLKIKPVPQLSVILFDQRIFLPDLAHPLILFRVVDFLHHPRMCSSQAPGEKIDAVCHVIAS